MSRKKFWVVMEICGWDTFRVEMGGWTREMKRPDSPNQPIGFLAVFNTKKEARAWGAADDILWQVRTVRREVTPSGREDSTPARAGGQGQRGRQRDRTRARGQAVGGRAEGHRQRKGGGSKAAG